MAGLGEDRQVISHPEHHAPALVPDSGLSQRLWFEVSALVSQLSFAQPTLLLDVHNTPAMHGDNGYWGRVAASLGLSPAQRRRLCPVILDRLTDLQALQDAQQRLLAALQVPAALQVAGCSI